MNCTSFRSGLAAIGFVFAFGACAQDKLSSDDRSFILQATNGGMTEVELSKIALQNSAQADVKTFAKHLVDDHQKAGSELATIAAKLGAVAYKPSIGEHADMKRFAQLTGEKLDTAYVGRMVSNHKGTIALFEKQAARGDAAELKEFARKTLPTLKEHLKMAMALAEKKK